MPSSGGAAHTGLVVWSPSPKGWPEGPRAEQHEAGVRLLATSHAASA